MGRTFKVGCGGLIGVVVLLQIACSTTAGNNTVQKAQINTQVTETAQVTTGTPQSQPTATSPAQSQPTATSPAQSQPTATSPAQSQPNATPPAQATSSDGVDRSTYSEVEKVIQGYYMALRDYDSERALSFLAEAFKVESSSDLVTGIAMAKDLNIKIEFLGIGEVSRSSDGVLANVATRSTGGTANTTLRLLRQGGQWKIAEVISKAPVARIAPAGVATTLGRIEFTPLEVKTATVSDNGDKAQGQFISLIYAVKNQGKRDFTPWSDFSFTLKDDQGREWMYEMAPFYRTHGLSVKLMQSIGPGSNGKDMITFDVPRDAKGLYILVGVHNEGKSTVDKEAGYLKFTVN